MTDALPILDQLDLVVADMDVSLAFYRLLGLDIPDEAVWRDAAGDHHAEMKMANGFALALNSPALTAAYNRGWSDAETGTGRTNLGFRMASREAVDALYAQLTGAGYEGSQPPYDAFWGARYAIVNDPDGNPVGLMSEADPGKRSAPPSL